MYCVFQPAFGCVQHLKAGQNTQHLLVYLVYRLKQILLENTRECGLWSQYGSSWEKTPHTLETARVSDPEHKSVQLTGLV